MPQYMRVLAEPLGADFPNPRGTLLRVLGNLREGLGGWECAQQALGATGAPSRCPPVLTAGLAFSSIGPMFKRHSLQAGKTLT